MAQEKRQYICNSCGVISATWLGRCYSCQEWDTFQEEVAAPTLSGASKGAVLHTELLKEVSDNVIDRIQVNYGEVDRVLGGGFVAGSVILIAGEPGVGKSTLLMHISKYVAKSNNSVLYISGEESAQQVAMRARRLDALKEDISIVSSNSADDIAATILSSKTKLVIVDSIQTISCSSATSSAGSVSQITASTHMLVAAAKVSNTCLILIGHVTKEGSIAGPKILEHIVDGVMQLEGDRYGGFKILRSAKNRYGSTEEMALFEMHETGLEPISNPSEALLAERQAVDGSVIAAVMEGSRPVLVEVQALVNKSPFGYPKRTASGIDLSRLNVLIAMLERRTKLTLYDKDIYINIVGGLKITEPAIDLAVCMAIGSATKALKLQYNCVVFGEVGLSGEVRFVPYIEKRVEEARKLGFQHSLGPKPHRGKKITSYKPTNSVRDALNYYLAS